MDLVGVEGDAFQSRLPFVKMDVGGGFPPSTKHGLDAQQVFLDGNQNLKKWIEIL